MNYKSALILVAFNLFFISFVSAKEKNSYQTPILVVGGGASGVTAGLQASRLGVKTLIIEETDWLGGMLTSAGVSAVDGNHQLPSGLWGEFRQKLYEYYGGPSKVETGWVSNTLFEPSVGNQIFKQMIAGNPQLSVWYNTKFSHIHKTSKGWEVEVLRGNKKYIIEANIVIDCTELGDVMAAAGAKFYVGMDSRSRTGEIYAPEQANDIIQDLTYVAILKDYGKGVDKTIPKPIGFDPKEFENSCDVADPSEAHSSASLDCEKMLTYGKLPNGKYMINWPRDGNDIYLNIIAKSPAERETELKKAKLHTLRFIYYIQTVLGYKNLGLSDEFGTKDKLPKIPYHREARRIDGMANVTVQYIEKPFEQDFPIYRTGVIVGDYTIDHHHLKNPDAPKIDFIKIKIPSYNIPLGALIPKDISNLIVAEKSIAVSNIVAGATRLQPVVLQIGQAAGALAALSVIENKDPKDISIRYVQTKLLDAQVYLMPYLDVQTSDSYFKAIQKIGATGILKGTGNPYKWANQTWFYPNHTISEYEMVKGFKTYYSSLANYQGSGADLTITEFIKMLLVIKPTLSEEIIRQKYKLLSGKEIMKRKEVAILIDELLNPFAEEVDWVGNLK